MPGHHRFFRSLTLCLLLPLLARATNIKRFDIINSSSLSTNGGVLANGGTYSGWFLLDVDATVMTNNPLTPSIYTFDVRTTGPLAYHFDSTSASAFYIGSLTQVSPIGNAQLVQLVFAQFVNNTLEQLILMMINPLAGFRGGVVLNATLQTSIGTTSDTTGSALIIDPDLVAPEPASFLLAAAGLALALWRRKRLLAEQNPRGIGADVCHRRA